MWKYVTRRIRDTFERSVNHLDKRSSAGVVNSSGSLNEDTKYKQSSLPCRWYCPRKCWNSFQNENDTKSNRWNFEHLNRTWIGAITWSSALVLGWYTSQLIHLKIKYYSKDHERRCISIYDLFSSLQPQEYRNAIHLNSVSAIEKIVNTFTPTVHLISNEQNGGDEGKSCGASAYSTSSDSLDNDLGVVLNSIENKLGLAAIENGQHQEGLNLLRSAANRNHAPALYNLGLCYEMGLGVTIDEKMAMELYKSAAAKQHPGGLYNLGIYYGQGRGGLQRDFETATRLLRLAAVQGQEDAIVALKALEIDLKEAPKHKEEDTWTYQYNPLVHNENIVPTHTTHFVEDVNFLLSHDRAATVY